MNESVEQQPLRERTIETATAMFVESGYHGISMREIADSLGV